MSLPGSRDSSSLASSPKAITANKDHLSNYIRRHHEPRHIKRYFLAVLTILCITATLSMTWIDVRTRATVVAKLSSQDKLRPQSNETMLRCGEGLLTHRNGCTLDIVLSGWIPDPCFDAELYANYTGPGRPDNLYYTTQAATERIPQDVVMKGHLTGVWTTWQEHITHCEYVLKGLGRVLANPSLGINEKYLDFEHTQHCIDAIAGRHKMKMPLNKVTTHLDFEDIACLVRARG